MFLEKHPVIKQNEKKKVVDWCQQTVTGTSLRFIVSDIIYESVFPVIYREELKIV